MADASIYNALRQPPKSSLEYAAEYGALGDQMAKRRQNALLMKQQQQEYDDDQAVRAALSRVAPDAPLEARVGALRATGLPGGLKAADALEAARLKADQDKAGLLKTQAETEKIKADKAKLIHGEIKGSLGFVLANPTPEAAESAISRIESMFGIDGTQYRNEVARLRTPEDFKMWAAGHSIDADKQLTTFTTRNTGGSTDTLAQNQILGTVTVANSVKNTQSPDSVALTAVQRRGQDINASIARERLNFDRGQVTAEMGGSPDQVALSKRYGKAQPGYRWRPDGSLEAIPGGPADTKAGAEAEKTQARKSQQLAQAKSVLQTVDEARNLVGVTTAGLGGVTRAIPATSARDLSAKLETIKANLGFDRLQQMREASPTGGALGNVAIQELTALQSTVASLDQLQSPAEVRRALDKISTHYRNWANTLNGEKAGPQVVRTGKDASGRKVQQMSDGSIQYAD